jgi:hypothetical protein
MMLHGFLRGTAQRDIRTWSKNKGMGYAKGGKGIETQPASKRQPNDPFNMRKVKGSIYDLKRNIIYREKSKGETA